MTARMDGRAVVRCLAIAACMLMVVACGSEDSSKADNDDGWNVGGDDQADAGHGTDAGAGPDGGEWPNGHDQPDADDGPDADDPSPAAIVEVRVEPSTMTIAVGERMRLEAVAVDEDGTEVEVDAEDVHWSSDDESVVVVDDDGEVTGFSAGQSQVTARIDDVSGEAQIDVEEQVWRDVAAGSHVSCAVNWEGELYCWGTDHYGMSGQQDFAQPMYSEPVKVALPIDVEGVTVGGGHYCAWDEEGETHCWGFNHHGQVGAPAAEQVYSPTPVLGGPFVSVDAAFQHNCAVTEEGEIYCWGNNENGELGTSELDESSEPVRVDVDEVMVDVSTGFHHSCGVSESGSVFCWGRNFAGAIDPWSPADQVVLPTEVDLFGHAVEVEVGGVTTCVLTATESVMCWGFNVYGEVGRDAPTGQIAFPAELESDENFVELSAMLHTVCGITDGGELKCWGDNRFGTVGDASNEERSVPSSVDGQWRRVSVGQTHGCGIDATDEIHCWGGNGLGEVGDGRSTREYSLQPVGGEKSTFDELVMGGHVVCGIDASAEQTYCWGRNESMQQQVDRPGITGAPRQLPNWSPTTMALGDGFGCGIDGDDSQAGVLQCWGANHHGQLGLSIYSTNASADPLPVDSLELYRALDLGHSHGCAVADGGDVFCWGDNAYGQVGRTNGSWYYDEPLRVDLEGDDFVDVATGDLHSCALNSDGEVWCWGANEFGQLGHGKSSGMEEAAKVDFGHNFVAIEAASHHTCGLNDEADVVCWGNGTFLTGNPDSLFAENPRVFEGPWETLAVGDFTVCAIADDALFCGGWDVDGWLGSPIPMAVNDLRAVDEEVVVTDVAVQAGHLCVLDDSGQTLCRGADAFGVLGSGAEVIYSEPNMVVMP